MKPYTIAIAGSTEHTVQCAQALVASGKFAVPWVLTPTPKLTGRTQTLIENPVHHWATENQVPAVLVEKKIDSEVRTHIETEVARTTRPDFLLVVDFGYLVPEWLLKLPMIAPLNVHPSLLPKWRGSSPGQFVLLSGEKNSAVTLMQMDKGLDTGPIIRQEKFEVDLTWTQTEYYQHSFEIISQILADQIVHFAETGLKHEQPAILPTPLARRLTKEDGFIAWEELRTAASTSNRLFQEVLDFTHQPLPQVLEQASRAFSPWPTLWTMIPTTKGEKRMQILKCHVEQDQLILDDVKIEGQDKAKWPQVKNQIQEK